MLRKKESLSLHASFISAGIIFGPHRGSFAVRDHLRSNLGIISGPKIICGRGSFAALYHRRITQFAWVADCYFIVNVLDLPFAPPIAIYR